MFGKLLSGLLAPAPAALPEDEARLALAALLVRVARADDRYTDAEAHRIDRVLSARHALTPFEAADLRGRAEVLESEAPDTVRFTRALKEAVPHDERMALIEGLWSVALADASRDADEDAVIRLIASLLGIGDRDSAIARQRVEARG
jgi:uncharacterized tellurite resistance protein B-like protein